MQKPPAPVCPHKVNGFCSDLLGELRQTSQILQILTRGDAGQAQGEAELTHPLKVLADLAEGALASDRIVNL